MYIVNNEELAELVIMMRFAQNFCNGDEKNAVETSMFLLLLFALLGINSPPA